MSLIILVAFSQACDSLLSLCFMVLGTLRPSRLLRWVWNARGPHAQIEMAASSAPTICIALAHTISLCGFNIIARCSVHTNTHHFCLQGRKSFFLFQENIKDLEQVKTGH